MESNIFSLAILSLLFFFFFLGLNHSLTTSSAALHVLHIKSNKAVNPRLNLNLHLLDTCHTLLPPKGFFSLVFLYKHKRKEPRLQATRSARSLSSHQILYFLSQRRCCLCSLVVIGLRIFICAVGYKACPRIFQNLQLKKQSERDRNHNGTERNNGYGTEGTLPLFSKPQCE